MTWTATLTDLKNEISQWKFEIKYTNGSTQIVKAYRVVTISDKVIETTAQKEIEQLVKVKEAEGETSIKVGDFINIIDSFVIPPPPVKSEKQIWLEKFTECQKLKRAIAEGFISEDNDYLTLKEEVKSLWNSEYKDLI